MNSATPRRTGARRSRLLAALTAGILLVTTPLLGAVSAAADPVEYVGNGANAADFDVYDGDRTLAGMIDGEEYSDTLTGPQFSSEGTDWCWSVIEGALPGDLEMSVDGECAPSATFSGTPAAGSFTFKVQVTQAYGEGSYTLSFSQTIASAKSPTITTLTAPALAPYASLPLSAAVVGNPDTGIAPTGTVEFYDGAVLIGSADLEDGVAATTETLDIASAGAALDITAKYLGDANYQPSTSAATPTRIFAPLATGAVQWNGAPVVGATVALLDGTDTSLVIDTDTTDAEGEFELDPGTITTGADIDKTYVVRVTFADATVLFYKSGTANVTDIATADSTGPATWTTSLAVSRTTAPVWTDAVLATPRIGTVYSDAVAAASQNAVTYTVSAGTLPGGLTLSPSTGAVAGTPTCGSSECDYDFTITADNDYGTVTQQFTGTLLPAGVPPTWEDDEIEGLRVDVATDDGVLAVGDPTITYAVTAGTLPAGVTLWPTTGALSGTPTTAGPYEFTITATNDFGSIDADFEGDVAAAPELDLTLDFAPGTSIEDAASTISADGLQVGSTYTLTMFSTPRVLFTGTIDASGGFSRIVALPADTPAGAHRLLLTGIAANGTPMSAQAWFSLRADGTIGAVSYTGPVGGLAATGAEPVDAALVAGLLLVLGVAALTIRRRRAA